MYGGRIVGMFGYSHFTGSFAGGQAEYVRVPYGDVNLLKLPDDVPDEKGLYLSNVLSTSWNCVLNTGVEKGDVVAVWAPGLSGRWLLTSRSTTARRGYFHRCKLEAGLHQIEDPEGGDVRLLKARTQRERDE